VFSETNSEISELVIINIKLTRYGVLKVYYQNNQRIDNKMQYIINIDNILHLHVSQSDIYQVICCKS